MDWKIPRTWRTPTKPGIGDCIRVMGAPARPTFWDQVAGAMRRTWSNDSLFHPGKNLEVRKVKNE